MRKQNKSQSGLMVITVCNSIGPLLMKIVRSKFEFQFTPACLVGLV